MSGSGSIGRALAFQAKGRGFEPRFPLINFGQLIVKGPRSSGVEHLLGKEEVMSSNLIVGSAFYKSGF